MIDQRMWDDPDFVSLDRFTQMLWVYLLVGPEARDACPGLVRGGVASLSEALRVSSSDVHTALRTLSAPPRAWLKVYPELRLIHIPRAPAYRGSCSGNVLRGWFRKWARVPDCVAKRIHPTLMEPCRPAKGPAWDETFGSVAVDYHDSALPTQQKSLFGDGKDASPQSPKSLSAKFVYARKAKDPEQDPEQDRGVAARRLWDLQESLRAELGLPPVSPMGRDTLVAQLLGQYTETHLAHVLRVCARLAREQPRERDWFDGRRNWAPLVIEQRLGQSADPTPAPKRRAGEVGSAAPTPREEFGDGPQEIPR